MSDQVHPSKIAHFAATPWTVGQVCSRCAADISIPHFPPVEEGTVVTVFERGGAKQRQLHGRSVPFGYVECKAAVANSGEQAQIPRRNRLDRNTPAELAIRAAVDAVERAGAHPLLTDAVILLGQAREKVADFVDLRGGLEK